MAVVALKLCWLVLLLLPLVLASAALWRRYRRHAPASEILLASLITVPIVLLVFIVVLGNQRGELLRRLHAAQIALSCVALLVCWFARGSFFDAMGALRRGVTSMWRQSSGLDRLGLLAGLLVQTAATLYGAVLAPWAWDELGYHLPQAYQPYQDGFLGPVQANVIWADSYPRGVALLYYWTIQLTHTDAGVHPVNGAFGFVFILATYVAARRIGLAPGWSALAAGIVPTAPIFSHLSTIGYIDLSVGAALATALAFCLNERSGRWGAGSAVAFLASCMLALWMKFPPIMVIGLAMVVRLAACVLSWRRARAGRASEPGVKPLALCGMALVFFFFASVPYLRTWAVHGSPVYPLNLRVGSVVLIPGPMDTSAFQRGNQLPLLKRYAWFWTDWMADLNADSPGSFGPLLLVCFVPATLAAAVFGFRARRLDILLLSGAFWLALVLPEHHVPRYAIFILLPGSICAAVVGQHLLAGWSTMWKVVLLGVACLNALIFARDARMDIRWQRTFGLPLMTSDRNHAIIDQVYQDDPYSPRPALRAELRRLTPDGSTVVACVLGLQSLLHDHPPRYSVVHRPARDWPYRHFPCRKPDWGSERVADWLHDLRRGNVFSVIVYIGTAEDRVLEQPGSGFKLSFEQPPFEDSCGIRLYTRE